MNQLFARAIIILWESKQFSTADIAAVTGVAEHEVARFLQASRDAVRQIAGSAG